MKRYPDANWKPYPGWKFVCSPKGPIYHVPESVPDDRAAEYVKQKASTPAQKGV